MTFKKKCLSCTKLYVGLGKWFENEQQLNRCFVYEVLKKPITCFLQSRL